MERTWSLYNRVEKLRVDDLRPDQVRTILLAIPPSQLSNWYACQEGDLQWVALESVSEFYMDSMANRQKASALPKASGDDSSNETPDFNDVILPVSRAKTNQRRPLFEDAPDNVIAGDFEVKSEDREDRRSSVRYPRKIEVRIVLGKKVFSTHTLNISMGGMKLAQELPDWMPRTFRAELALNGQSVYVFCKKIGPDQVRLMESDSWSMIRQWLVNG